LQDDLIRLGMLGEFSLYNDAKAAQFKKNVWPVFPVNVDRLGFNPTWRMTVR
jgi:hypothetical protein